MIVEVVEGLEQKGYGPFIEISYDNGQWEVEVYKQNVSYELAVNGHTGEIVSEHRDDAVPRPPCDAQSLSQVLRKLINAGYTSIDEVSFGRRYSEIEAFRGAGKYELHIHPTMAEIVGNRRDN